MKLQNVYDDLPVALPVLWDLLAEREPHECISHRQMPTWVEHVNFVRSIPYAAWYLILDRDEMPAGAVYLSRQWEIGIGVLRAHRRRGLARDAIFEVIRRHGPHRFLANINPANEASIALFRSLGCFDGPIQITLEAET